MALSKKPVTGMKDILPEEMEIRDYVISVIKETYKEFGFTSIETPCVENIANLNCKAGGENEKLIFKILKRGEKLRLEEAESADELVDGGLRYDLTVPLVRYYSNHVNELPSPFKALQMGNVWRADRPQRGRYRQFMQCDIDILGEPSNLAEIELILATTTTLGRLGFHNFQIRINDRRTAVLRKKTTIRSLSFWIKWTRSGLTACVRSCWKPDIRRNRPKSIWDFSGEWKKRTNRSLILRIFCQRFFRKESKRVFRKLSAAWKR